MSKFKQYPTLLKNGWTDGIADTTPPQAATSPDRIPFIHTMHHHHLTNPNSNHNPDRSQNVVDSLRCRCQSLRWVSWKSAGNCMRNANKSQKISYSAMMRDVEKWSGIGIRDRINTKTWSVLPIGRSNHENTQVSVKSADYFCSNPAHTHTPIRTNDTLWGKCIVGKIRAS